MHFGFINFGSEMYSFWVIPFSAIFDLGHLVVDFRKFFFARLDHVISNLKNIVKYHYVSNVRYENKKPNQIKDIQNHFNNLCHSFE